MEENREERLQLAHEIIERTGCSLFLTGKAGTGKTTFLHKLRATSRKRMVVAAPTGIAAINAGGVTLHSFFQLDFKPYIPGAPASSQGRAHMAFSKEKIKIIRGMDLLVIDEVSMVRSDMLDAVDAVLRRLRDHTQPFGGVQLLLIGDLQQLPPVVIDSEKALLAAHYRSPYFFDSKALASVEYVTVELNKVFRQKDREFINILNAVRENRADSGILARLNERWIPGFNPSEKEGYVRLTTHNHLANAINEKRLSALRGKTWTYKAGISGKFPETSYPADENLQLKMGAQVMFIKNDTGQERRYFNGMLGQVTALDEERIIVTAGDSGEQIEVERAEWENVKFAVDDSTHEIKEEREGVFSQYPLRLAWGITIHKSQGLTFDRAIIDATSAFTHGQTYVALSRCRTLEGLVLERPIPPQAIITDPAVSGYMDIQRSQSVKEENISAMSHAYRLALMESLFNFRPLFNSLEGITRLLQENFSRLFPVLVSNWSQLIGKLRTEMVDVSDKFRLQLRQLSALPGTEGTEKIRERVKDACRYFAPKLTEIREAVKKLPVDHDNRKTQRKLRERIELYAEIDNVARILTEEFSVSDFDTDLYLDLKARGALSTGKAEKQARKREKIRKAEIEKERPNQPQSDASKDNLHPELFDLLRAWRSHRAQEANAPAYTVASTRSLLAVANYLPASKEDLLALPGFGKVTVERIGDALLEIVSAYVTKDGNAPIMQFTPPKRKQPRKGETRKISLQMFNSGKTIEEIAEERGLSPNTIGGHLVEECSPVDEEFIKRITSQEMTDIVNLYLDSHPTLPETWAEIREELKSDCAVYVFDAIASMRGIKRIKSPAKKN